MGKVERTIRSEISRLARKEVRATLLPLKRELRVARRNISVLKKTVAALDRATRERMRGEQGKKFQIEASPEEVKASRFTPQRIRTLRQRLGISQKQLALLAKVSIGAVGSWEKGKFEPKGDKKAVLLGLRKLKKRGVKKLLAGMNATRTPEPKEGKGKERGRRAKPALKARRRRSR